MVISVVTNITIDLHFKSYPLLSYVPDHIALEGKETFVPSSGTPTTSTVTIIDDDGMVMCSYNEGLLLYILVQ